MSAVAQLLDRLASRGLTIRVRGDQLVLSPASLLTDDLAEAVRASKPALILALTTWDDRHADDAITAMLSRIESRYPQDAPLGTTWGDQHLADCWEALNVAAQSHDRGAFDGALVALENYVIATYGRVASKVSA